MESLASAPDGTKGNRVLTLVRPDQTPMTGLVQVAEDGGSSLWIKLPRATMETMKKAAAITGRPIEVYEARAAQALIDRLLSEIGL